MKAIVLLTFLAATVLSCRPDDSALFSRIEGKWKLQKLQYHLNDTLYEDQYQSVVQFYNQNKNDKQLPAAQSEAVQDVDEKQYKFRYYASSSHKLNILQDPRIFPVDSLTLASLGHTLLYDIVQLSDNRLVLYTSSAYDFSRKRIVSDLEMYFDKI